MQKELWEIDPELLETAYHKAWSIQNMEAHEAGNRSVEYIGSQIAGYLDNDSRNGQRIHDYYIDSVGDYWFDTRALLPSGEMVSMDMYIFGHELKKRTGGYQWKRRN